MMDESAEAVETEDRLTLGRPATYQIKVPGHLDESWIEWDGRMTVEDGYESDCSSATTLIGTVDQTALYGILRRLYSLGLPLVSVNLVERN